MYQGQVGDSVTTSVLAHSHFPELHISGTYSEGKRFGVRVRGSHLQGLGCLANVRAHDMLIDGVTSRGTENHRRPFSRLPVWTLAYRMSMAPSKTRGRSAG